MSAASRIKLPYIEQDSVYKRFDVKAGYAGNLAPAGTPIKTFVCPESKEVKPGDAVTNYVAMAGIGSDAAPRPAGAAGNGFMGYDRATSLRMIPDGTSNTIALMETRSGLGPSGLLPAELRRAVPPGPRVDVRRRLPGGVLRSHLLRPVRAG